MNVNQSAGIGARVSQRTPAQPQPTAEQQHAMDEIKRIQAQRAAAKVAHASNGRIRGVADNAEIITNAEAVCDQMIAAGRVKIIGRKPA